MGIDNWTDKQVIDAAIGLSLDSRAFEVARLREENAELRRELGDLKTLIHDWAHCQRPPANHKPGDDLMSWLRTERALYERLLQIGYA